MAGTKERSGKRTRFAEYKPSQEAPELDPYNYDSLLQYLAWIAREQAAGNMDRADAKELRDTVKAMSIVKKARHGERELIELRELLSSARDEKRKGKENAMADRYGRGGKAEKCPDPNDEKSSTKSNRSVLQSVDTSTLPPD